MSDDHVDPRIPRARLATAKDSNLLASADLKDMPPVSAGETISIQLPPITVGAPMSDSPKHIVAPNLEIKIQWVLDKMRTMNARQINLIGDAVERALKDHGKPPEGFKRQKIVADKGLTVEFVGRMLAEYSTARPGASRGRWTELRLWETQAGAWIAESIGCSDSPGEADIVDAKIFPVPMVALPVQTMANFREGLGREAPLPREIQVMDWFGWSRPARALAKQLGWSLTLTVD